MRVGVFDSGLGGLTVVKSILNLLKGTKLFYIADTKHAPYGEKTTEEILQYSLDITDYFIKNHQIDALVIACNTATSAAITVLRETYPNLIIIGTEPGIKPAIKQTQTGNVGVLATPATLKSEKYQQLVNRYAKKKDVTLFEQACPGLVEQIEKGKSDHHETEKMLENWLHPMRDTDVDTIVLGCTHYPLVSNLIEKIMERRLTLIHTGDAIAKRLLSLGLQNGYSNNGHLILKLYTTGGIDMKSVQYLLGYTFPIENITLNSYI